MSWKLLSILSLVLLPAFISGVAQTTHGVDPLHDFEARAAKFKSVICLPQFEATTNEIRATLQQTISSGNAALDALAALDPKRVTFQNTVGALDKVAYDIGLTANRFSVIKETSQDAAL